MLPGAEITLTSVSKTYALGVQCLYSCAAKFITYPSFPAYHYALSTHLSRRRCTSLLPPQPCIAACCIRRCGFILNRSKARGVRPDADRPDLYQLRRIGPTFLALSTHGRSLGPSQEAVVPQFYGRHLYARANLQWWEVENRT